MLTYAATSRGSAETAWRLLAEPGRWSRWAPHIRGAWGLGSPEVEAGRRGAVLLAPRLPIPARILAKRPGRSWEWQVGPARMTHAVHREGDGCRVEVAVQAPGPLELAVQASYGPLIWLMVSNLARIAGQGR